MINISDVNVIVSLSQATGQAGTWYPLIYVKGESETTTFETFSGLDELVKKYAETTDAYKTASLMLMQGEEYAPEKFAVCTGGATVMTSLAPYMYMDWRQLAIAGGEFDENVAKAIADTEKLYFVHFNSKEELVEAKVTDYERTVAVVSSADVTSPEIALVGRTAGYVAGSCTYHAKEVKGVTAENLSSADVDAITKAGGNVYVMKNGKVASHGGIVGSGEWIDVIDSKDYIIQNVRYDVQEVFLNNPKIGYTDEGIQKIENAVRNRLQIAFNNGMIAADENGTPLYNLNFPKRSATTTADRASRNYPYGYFDFELAGAIHNAKIKAAVVA